MNYAEIKQKICQAAVISFDVFDTLIVCLYRKPVDLFRHIEESENISGFMSARVEAERSAREKAEKKGVHEVTLREIYEEMHSSYHNIMEKEICLEKAACCANPEMQEIYGVAQRMGKRIVISSDMYLPGSVLEEILHRCGYDGYERLFLSSDTRRPKATGEMYEDLVATLHVPGQEILHIGDHPYTDIQMAKEKGVRAYQYERISESYGGNLNAAYFAILNRCSQQGCAASIVESMITLHTARQPKEDYWKQFGYKYAAPVVCAYVRWLKERMDCYGIRKAYFMLRDGYLFKRVFDSFYPEFESREIYGSQRLFLLAGMSNYSDIKNVMRSLYAKEMTFAELWDWLGLSGKELHNAYLRAFPDQEQMILSEEDFDQLDEFMEGNECLLQELGTKERECLSGYFERIGLFQDSAAVIDLDWKASMLKSLHEICEILGQKDNLMGFYLGTHVCKTPFLRMESYLLDHGISTGATNAQVLTNYGFIIPILEFVFSAPYGSILGIKQQGDEYTPVYQGVNRYEEERLRISQLLLDGVMEFVADLAEMESAATVMFSKELALAPLEYFANAISPLDRCMIEQVPCCFGEGNHSCYRPIYRTGNPVIGIINPWPGDKSAEAEVLTRFKRAADENDIQCIYLDNFGHILDNKQRATDKYVDAKDMSFVLTTHYETPKVLDAFHYHTLWNPPEIPMNLEYYTERVTNQYIMNDDFLIYDSGGMSNHLKSMLMNCPRTLEGASSLTASFPKSAMLSPNLDKPLMFYCGMNWEKVVHGTNRHEGLFKLLDNTGKVRFYGPEQVEAWGGLRPWDGYRCYQYSIPFDGFSILKEINHCGICLVLSSDIHRRAGAATNRTYEACAAGAVMISDDNPFMLEYFKDAALFIVYNKNDPEDTFRQIMEKYEWVLAHPKESLELAKRAQKIFEEKFSLDIQLERIVERHPKRFQQIAQDLYARDCSQKVLVTYVLNTQDKVQGIRLLDQVFDNIKNQIYPNIELGIAVDDSICSDVEAYASERCASAKVIPIGLFDTKGIRKCTDGQAIRQIQKMIPHKYYLNTTGDEIWFTDHITTLVRSLENSGGMCAYSGSVCEDIKKFRRVFLFNALDSNHLYQMSKPEEALMAGQFLFSSDAHALVPDFLFDSLDGTEHYAYAALIHYKHGERLEFSRRSSFVFYQNKTDARASVLPIEMQRRFIQDLVRFDLPERALRRLPDNNDSIDISRISGLRKTTADMLSLMPLKTWFLLRYYRAKMRKLDPASTKYKAVEKKYQEKLNAFNAFWGI